ncbi:MAG: YIP1 family protein [Anaerolineales bacterium]|nr:YIP1 family protein [Anaerolineales bacterium]
MEQMPSNTPVTESKPGPAGWVQTWIMAVTKPNEQTFIEISESPDAKVQTALIWAVIAGLISGIMLGIGFAIQSLIQGGGSSNDMGTIALLICGMPIAMAIINPIGLSFSTALFQWVAKLFGGVGSFEKLIYPLSAITLPITIVSGIFSLLSSIPIVGVCISFFSFAISIYATALNIMAVKAVNRFDWGKAIGSVLIPAFAIGIFCGCVVFIGLMILGPAIANTFNQINQGLVP